VPDALHDLWARRVAEVVRDDDELALLELAAVLGTVVVQQEWEEAAVAAGLQIRPGLVHALAERRLAIVEDRGWRFAHGLLAESLVRLATEAGRVAAHHRAALRALKGRTAQPQSHDRLAHHHRGAGDPRGHVGALLSAASAYQYMGDLATAVRRMESAEREIEAIGLPELDPLRLKLLEERAILPAERDHQIAAYAALLEAARAHGSDAQRTHALNWFVVFYASSGHLDIALRLSRLAISLAQREGGLWLFLYTRRSRAYLNGLRGDRLGALAVSEEAYSRVVSLELSDHRHWVSQVLTAISFARHTRLAGRHEQAAAALERARLTCEQVGSRSQLTRVEQNAADLEKEMGNHQGAVERMTRAMDFALPGGQRDVMKMDLAIPLAMSGRGGRARALALEAFEALGAGPNRTYALYAHWTLLVAAAAASDWPLWRRHVAPALEGVAASRALNPDLGELGGYAGELAASAGRHDLARPVLQAAMKVYDKAPQMEHRAAQLLQLLDTMPGQPHAPLELVVRGDLAPAADPCWAGLLDGHEVATMTLEISALEGSKTVLIRGLSVAEEHRNRGLASQLLRGALASAFDAGCVRALARDAPTAFLEREGFQRTRSVRQAKPSDGWWSLALREPDLLDTGDPSITFERVLAP
jgi:eukaryotic-like serine/threonine-protein kinase